MVWPAEFGGTGLEVLQCFDDNVHDCSFLFFSFRSIIGAGVQHGVAGDDIRLCENIPSTPEQLKHLLIDRIALQRLALSVGPTKCVDESIVADAIRLDIRVSQLEEFLDSLYNLFGAFRVDATSRDCVNDLIAASWRNGVQSEFHAADKTHSLELTERSNLRPCRFECSA